MKPVLPLAALALICSAGSNFADPLEVNGITSLFGENMASLVLHQPAETKPVSFILSQGRSRFGIKLLAVDMANHRVQIERAGEVQYLPICAPPILTTPASIMENMIPAVAVAQAPPEEQLAVNRFLAEDKEVQRIKNGNPVPPLAYIGAAYPNNPKTGDEPGHASDNSSGGSDAQINSGNSSNFNSGGNTGTADSRGEQSNRSSTGSDSSRSPAVDVTKQYWYVASMNIERNRLATAAQVMAGEMEALPATPLTPAGTPPILIGAETYFANHIAGFPDNSLAEPL